MRESKKNREAIELAKLKILQAAKKPACYLGIVMVVLTIVYIVDEITSSMNSAMQPYILFDLFNITSRDVNSELYKHAINVIAPLSMLSTFLLIVTPFYKALADRFGRRIFLMINTMGMGVGMLIVMMSSAVWQYIIGVFVMSFFTPNDMQVLYIMEVAPKEKRATYSFIAKGIALMSASLIGVFSKIFLKEELMHSWKNVYFIPVVLALVIGFACVFFVKETPVFLDQRIAYLSLTEEERKAKKEEEKKNNTSENGGVINALKFIFTNKQLRWILIAGFIFFVTTVYTSYYATVLEGAMSTNGVATAMIIFPLANGIMTIVSGFISDRIGRKKACITLGAITLLALLVFIFACRAGLGPVVAGIAYGISIGGLWSMSDTIILTMPAESTPSGMRASVMGTISVLIGAGMFVGQGLFILCQNFMPMDMVFLIISVPFMALSLFIIMAKVKETKDVDLENITADTYK